LVPTGAVVAVGAMLAALVLQLVFGRGSDSWVLATVAPVVGCAAVGAVLANRVPSNAIGWLFLLVALETAVGQLCGVYEQWSSAPGSLAAGVVASGLQLLPLMFFPALLVLFPEGRLPSRAWHVAAVAWAILVAVTLADILVMPGPLSAFSSAALPNNPLALGGGLGKSIRVAGGVSFFLLSLVGVGAAVSLVRRFRRATGELRLQLKWFAACALVLALAVGSGPVGLWSPWNGEVWVFAWELALTGVVVATGIAVLRYRLYEIDVLIRRTLVYTALAIALAALYLSGIYLIGRGLQTVTGQSGALAVTLSTLAVAAVFQPLRSRIQHAVDRRFYRQTYDAAQSLETFTSRLRDQIDLAALEAELLDIVQSTLQPRQAGLWLRPSADPSANRGA
jgi:hypothetical protein